MKTFTFFYSLLLLLSLHSCNNSLQETVQSDLKLWYHQPANASVPDDPNGWRDDPEWLKQKKNWPIHKLDRMAG